MKRLDTSRFRAVLKLAAEKSGWGTPLPAGQGRGIACFYSFDSYIAHVAEVTVEEGRNRPAQPHRERRRLRHGRKPRRHPGHD